MSSACRITGRSTILPSICTAAPRETASAQQLDWARRVLAAVAVSRGAAVQIDGKMVDRPVILQAEDIVARAERG